MNNPPQGAPQRVLCLWLPNWPIQRRLVARPELDPDQALLLTWRQRGALRVAACSKAARQAGVVCETPLAEADSLLRRAGKRPWVLPHQPHTDWETLCELAEHCEPLSPRVGCECMTPFRWLDSNPHRDCLWLDASNLAAIYGGERELAAHACRWLMQWGYYARGGLADTVGAAWAAARQLAHAQRPWVRIAPGRQFAALAQLPVSCLRLPERLTQDLRRLGVLRVRQAAQLPRRLVPARLGETLLWRLDQARGDAAETIVPLRAEPVLLAARELEPPALDGQAAMCVLRELLGELLRRLPSRNHGIHRLTCRFRNERGRLGGWNAGLMRASADPAHLEQLMELQCERGWMRGPDAAPVTAIELRAIAARLDFRQQHLFANESGHDASNANLQANIARLMDRLSSRLGAEHVLQARLTSDAQPELACDWRPWSQTRVAKTKNGSQSQASQDESNDPWRRPLWLVPQARRLQVVMDSGRRPRRLQCGQRVLEIAACWGPERIETAWWRGPSVRRIYYRVQGAAGELFWIYQESGAWWLHGEF